MTERQLDIEGIRKTPTLASKHATPLSAAHSTLATAAANEGAFNEAQAWAAIGNGYALLALPINGVRIENPLGGFDCDSKEQIAPLADAKNPLEGVVSWRQCGCGGE